jgi:hypothetical protein
MLLYSLLHLSGYDLPLQEIKNFRQWGSLTPGHPERGHTPGVETTTGPLGQGVGNAVGMAIAERFLADHFNRADHTIVDHGVWAMASDGDLMEGVASEVASLAGHLRLGKLNVIYDDNHITIDGDTALSFSEDVGRRFESYGWHVVKVARQALRPMKRPGPRSLARPSSSCEPPSPTRLPQSAIPPTPMEPRWAPRRFAAPRKSWDGRWSPPFTYRRMLSPTGAAPFVAEPTSSRTGRAVTRHTRLRTPTWRRSSGSGSPDLSRKAGIRLCRCSRRPRASSPPGRLPAWLFKLSPQQFPTWSAGQRTWEAVPEPL